MKKISPFALVILDGWGISPSWGGNAISLAETSNMNRYWSIYPHTQLKASGDNVGLPGQEMGNSEVGHLSIGTGRVLKQDISRINQSISDGSFFKNPVINAAFDWTKKHNSSLHFVGLVSDGGVHSHINHLFSLLDYAQQKELDSVFIHAFCDGRDTPTTAAISFIAKLTDKINQTKVGRIASIGGRYYAMDRDKRWERTEREYRVIVEGKSAVSSDARKAVSANYAAGKTDEFIEPTSIEAKNQPAGQIKDGDAVLFFNFRADRMRQIVRSICDPKFKEFHTKKLKKCYFASLVPYEYENSLDIKVAFPVPAEVKNCLAEILSNNNLTQLHLAETEKYAHITYFFNGGRENPFPGEKRILIPSQKISTYDLQPEMSAAEIAQTAIENLNKFDFMVINFANADMVGHTGNMQATIAAVTYLDKIVGSFVNEMKRHKGVTIITGDHGNAEQMLNPKTSEPETEHSTSDVPFIIIDDVRKYQNLHPGRLANIAPTILEILDIPKPQEMENSLFAQNHYHGLPTTT